MNSYPLILTKRLAVSDEERRDSFDKLRTRGISSFASLCLPATCTLYLLAGGQANPFRLCRNSVLIYTLNSSTTSHSGELVEPRGVIDEVRTAYVAISF